MSSVRTPLSAPAAHSAFDPLALDAIFASGKLFQDAGSGTAAGHGSAAAAEAWFAGLANADGGQSAGNDGQRSASPAWYFDEALRQL